MLSNVETGSSEGSAAYHGYLKLKHNSRLAVDPSCPNINHSNFWECDWTDFNEGAVEAIPPNAPVPRGKEVDICMFIDSDQAGNK